MKKQKKTEKNMKNHGQGQVIVNENPAHSIDPCTKNKEKININVEALLESKEILVHVFKMSPYAITITRQEDGLFINVNDAFYNITGFTHDETINSSSISQGLWVNTEDRSKVIHELMSVGKVMGQEYKFKKKNGDIITGLFSADAIKLKTGNFIVSIINDISEHKRLEEVAQKKSEDLLAANARLKEIMQMQERSRLSLLSILEDEKLFRNNLHVSEERFRLAIDATEEALWEWDIQNNQEFFAPRWCEIIGYAFDDPELKHTYDSWASRIHPDDLDRVNSALKNHLENGTRYDVDYRHRHKSGKYRWQNSKGKAVFDKSGKPVKMVGCISDITERKLVEEELAKYRDHLEELVHNRTTALEKIKVAAEVANRSKTRFLSSMSHEIRTPLNAILGFSELLILDKQLTPKQQERMKTIYRSGEHLLALINDILEISKIEEGRTSINSTSFDLIAIFSDIENMFKSKMNAKGLSFLIETDEIKVRYIVSDEIKLRQILINLIGNAAKFTIEGGVAIRVRTENSVDGAILITVEVEDTGPGISEIELKGLFKVFEQGKAGIKSGGTGLGLAISRQYASLLGGDISVRSEEGKGTCFSLKINVTAGENISVDTKNTEQIVLGLESGQEQFRVLVADDQPDNRMLLRELLEQADFEVKEACDGFETIELFKSWSPHLILMDMRMTGMNGYEAIVQIKEIDKLETTKIVAVTASAFSEDLEKAMDWGADACLRKPFKAHELFECIQTMLGVKYIYDEKTPVSQASVLPLTIESLNGLSDDLIKNMLAAIIRLDRDVVIELINSIGANEIETAKQLSEMVKNYQYETLIALLKRRIEQK